MSKPTQLKRAPIVEALIDVRVQAPATVTVEQLRKAYAQLAGEYPKLEARQRWHHAYGIVAGTPISQGMSSTVDGLRFISADARQVGQFRLDGFSFSWLPPYVSWETFSAKARDAFKLFVQAVGAAPVSRIAVRYINRVEIPLPVVNLADYFNGLPQIPDDLTERVAGYLCRLAIPFDEDGSVCQVTQASEGPTNDAFATILDVDAFKVVNGVASTDEDMIWRTLDALRTIKNRVFFACITDKVVDLCNN